MRSRWFVSVAAAALCAYFAAGSVTHAAPTLGPPGAKRPVDRDPPQPTQRGGPLSIIAFRNLPVSVTLPNGTVMSGGPAGAMRYSLEVRNTSSAAVTSTLAVKKVVDFNYVQTLDTSFPISLGPQKSTTVEFTDPGGLTDGCNPTAYETTFTGSETRNVSVLPTCTFQFTPGASVPPMTNRVSYEDVRLRNTPKCGEPLAVLATVVNDTGQAQNVRLVLPFPPQGGGLGPRAASVPTIVNAKPHPAGNKLTVVTDNGNSFNGANGDYSLRVEMIRGDDNLAAPPSWKLNVQRTCTVRTNLL